MYVNTPREWWNKLDKEFYFTIDLAATKEDTLCDTYFTKEQNSLEQEWLGVGWCSPPWEEPDLYDWVKKAVDETSIGNARTVVMLLPMRITSAWWQEFVGKVKSIWPLQLDYDIPEGFKVEPHCIWIFGKVGK